MPTWEARQLGGFPGRVFSVFSLRSIRSRTRSNWPVFSVAEFSGPLFREH